MEKKFPHYTQLDSMDCGPTCLRMIAKYYGRSYTLQNLRKRSFITREGVSMLGISDAAESIGFRTQGVQLTVEQITDNIPLPCILHWNQSHFVVCYHIKKKISFWHKTKEPEYMFRIADPTGEKYDMGRAAFLQCWISSKQNNKDTGTALLLNPTPEFYSYTLNG